MLASGVRSGIMITIHATPRGYVFRWGVHESREFRLYRQCVRAMREFLMRRR